MARIIDPAAFAVLDRHAAYVVESTISGYAERQKARAKADAILAALSPQTPT